MATKEEIRKRVLEDIGVSDNQLDLVGRMLGLERDPRVSLVKVRHDSIEYGGLSVEVLLLEGFETLRKFKNYLSSNNLPVERIYAKRDGTYVLRNSGVMGRFLASDDSL